MKAKNTKNKLVSIENSVNKFPVSSLELSGQICENESVLRWLTQIHKIKKDIDIETTSKQSLGNLDEIHKCYQSMEDEVQLSLPNFKEFIPEPLQKRSRKYSSDSSLIEEFFNPSLKSGAIDTDLNSSIRNEEKWRPPKRPLEFKSQASGFSSTSPIQQSNPFVKRARHKTREDRYDVNRKYRPEAKTVTKKTIKKIDRKREDKRNIESIKVDRKSTRDLNNVVNRSRSKTIKQDRLTIRTSNGLGLFKNGRASSPVGRRRVPDLTFSEMDFLQNLKQKPRLRDKKWLAYNSGDVEKSKVYNKYDEISSFFKPTNKSLREVDLRQRSQSVPLHINDDQNNSNSGNVKDLGKKMEFFKGNFIENNTQFNRVSSSCPSPGLTDKRQNLETAINIPQIPPYCGISPDIELKLKPFDPKERNMVTPLSDLKTKSKIIETYPMSQNKTRHSAGDSIKQADQKIAQKTPVSNKEAHSASEDNSRNLKMEEEIGVLTGDNEASQIVETERKAEDNTNIGDLNANQKNTVERSCSTFQSNPETKSSYVVSSNDDTHRNIVRASEPTSTPIDHDYATKVSQIEDYNEIISEKRLSPSPDSSRIGRDKPSSHKDIDKTKFQASGLIYQGSERKSQSPESDLGFERPTISQNMNKIGVNNKVWLSDPRYSEDMSTDTTSEEMITRKKYNSVHQLSATVPQIFEQKSFLSESTIGPQNVNQIGANNKPWLSDPRYSEDNKISTTPEEMIRRKYFNPFHSTHIPTPIDPRKLDLMASTNSIFSKFMPLEFKMDKNLELPSQKSWSNKPFKSTPLDTVLEEENYKPDGYYSSGIARNQGSSLFEVCYETKPFNKCAFGFLGNQIPFDVDKYQDNKSQEIMQTFESQPDPVVEKYLSANPRHSYITDEINHSDESLKLTPFQDFLDENEPMGDHLNESDIEIDIGHQDHLMTNSYQKLYNSNPMNNFDEKLIHISNSVEDLSTFSNFWTANRQY